jgi:hypothetical protein
MAHTTEGQIATPDALCAILGLVALVILGTLAGLSGFI